MKLMPMGMGLSLFYESGIVNIEAYDIVGVLLNYPIDFALKSLEP